MRRHDSNRSLRLGRMTFPFLLGAVALAWFSAFRLGLAAWTVSETGLRWRELPWVLGRGALYDGLFVLYAVTPVALWSALVPERLWRTRGHRWTGWVLAFGAAYALLFTSVAEVVFWSEFGARFNFIAVDYLVYTHEVVRNIMESYPMPAIFAGIGAAAAGLLFAGRRRLAAALEATSPARRRLSSAALLCVAVTVTLAAVDSRMGRDARNPYVDELASSGPYQFFAAFRNNELDRFYPTLPAEDADRALRAALDSPGSSFLSSAPLDVTRRFVAGRPVRRLNVVLVMVESLSARFLARFGGDQALTPHLDALAEESLSFERFYATGTRTTRGLEAVTLSIPPTPGRSIVKRIGRESGYRSLGSVLRDEGYTVEFLYGGRGYFDNMNAFFAGNGYEVVDQSSVPADRIHFENAWGMADEDLFTQVLERGDGAFAAGRPFFFHVMTTSNHRPYTYPEGRVPTPSGSGRDGAVQYTDWAIGDLLERARTRPWFDDTVFVVVADHCASSAGKVDLPVERYHIPCLVHSPKHVAPGTVETVGGQIDLAPTLLALLGVDHDAPFFGRDLLRLDPSQGRAPMGTYQVLGLLDDGVLTALSPVKRVQQRVERGAPAVDGLAVEDPLRLERCIAYYQAASELFRRHGRAPAPLTVTLGRAEEP